MIKVIGLVLIFDAALSLCYWIQQNRSFWLEAGRWVRLVLGIALVWLR